MKPTTAADIVLHDPEVEASLVGAAMTWPDRVEDVASDLAAEDFYVPRCLAAWRVIVEIIAEDGKPDALVVADRMRQFSPDIDPDDLRAWLVGLVRDALPPRREHVEIVLRYAAARRLLAVANDVRAEVANGADPYSVASQFARDADLVGQGGGRSEVEAATMADLVASAEDLAPWVIEGIVRTDWRALIVAPEGVGKSVCLRQIAVSAAQGVHPFNHRHIPPVRTLIVDAENPKASIAETGGPLDDQVRRTVGDAYDGGRCLVWSRPGGLNIRDPRDRAEFVRELRNARPQLVVAGPVYKLVGSRAKGESYEDAAEHVLRIFDDLRVRFGFALILEHHAPKSQGGSRPLDPFGSQRWLAWPELGINLTPEKDRGLRVGRFRGDRLQCEWPNRLTRGDVWPFDGVWERGMDGGKR